MIRLSNGWYVMLADLALILFMVTAQAVHEGDTVPVAGNPLPAEATPIGIYRPGNGAPDLRQWLAAAGRDERMRLTVIARHTGDDSAAAARAAAALAHDAGEGSRARIVVEPADKDEVLAVLAYDRAPAGWHGDCNAPSSKENVQCEE